MLNGVDVECYHILSEGFHVTSEEAICSRRVLRLLNIRPLLLEFFDYTHLGPPSPTKNSREDIAEDNFQNVMATTNVNELMPDSFLDE